MTVDKETSFTKVNVKKIQGPTLTSGPGTKVGDTMYVTAKNPSLTVNQEYTLECTGPKNTFTGKFTGTTPDDKLKFDVS